MDLRHSKATLISLGAVDTTGVPALNQVARFFDADTVQGSPNLLFTGSVLSLTGSQNISSFLSIGASPAQSGSLRLANAGDIVVRNQSDNADFNVISFDGSANMIVGATSMPRITFATGPNIDFPSPIFLGDSSFISLATSPAQSGTIRLANASSIVFRNAANSADIPILSFATSDIFDIGDPSAPTALATIRINSPLTTTFGAFHVDGNADAIQMRVDAHSTQNSQILRVRDSSAASIFTVDDDGSFSFPKAISNIGIGAAPTQSEAMNIELFIEGPSDNSKLVGIRCENFVLGASADIVWVAVASLEGAVETTSDFTTQDVAQLVIGEPFLQISGAGSVTDESNLLIDRIGTTGDHTYGIKILPNNSTPATAAIFIGGAAGSSPRVSEAIVMQRNSDSGLVDWKFFTEVTNVVTGASAWTLQQQLAEGGYTNRLTVDNTGNILTTGNAITLGDGGGDSKIQFQGCTNFFLAINASPEEIVLGVGTSVSQAATSLGIDTNSIKFRLRAQDGQYMEVRTASRLLETPSGASVTAVALIPAGSFVVGITTRVTTGITGPAGYDVGDGVDVDLWGNSIAVALNTTSDITDFTSGALVNYPAVQDVIITSDGVDFTGGFVRVTVHYMRLNAPTS